MVERLDYESPSATDRPPRMTTFQVVALAFAGFLFVVLIWWVVYYAFLF